MLEIKKGLIVSCQALEGEPLHSSFIMSKMALAAKMGGAIGIRANGVLDINRIKLEVDLPIIGIIKKVYDNFPVFITPTIKEIDELCKEGVDVIAFDATFRRRPDGFSLSEFFYKIKEKYPNQLLMADISSLEEAINADRLGFDFIGTTLYGYTEDTEGCNIADNDFEFLKSLIKYKFKSRLIVEGKIDTPLKAKRSVELGVDLVVVGGAITRPMEITKKFVDKMSEVKEI
ncbi:Putative N-acetylmannosamine-6-phosphate 2-epimerase [Borrelia miyamotoi]|uniref:Putative N-acetylmannosamine-6-phosphate 2-epimerase n=1 Tax=Borrelia miyamotoi TaxID=47466 RepID=A0AAP8YUE0_9SPIR|nr:N-acetylmannosamine-6-phosphate 2-epimerase [Borrelia miyamotoi]AHH04768.1 N-acetylmannosamine-6-phosphate 2-epimerase [Borrelia miyamotoi FR64b]ATQ14610.1 N-acetylmannosamine-6-phosphate 2-epimerase [Borrelia miyamotoi]ATQ15795.1 N-acetylmannosamine-6-phosphate 2-epimerase [Borrelia miyamotoi]ATQ16939.1 N-acetylmannosamine-6-phosphate 2-epimerase [Borrelia miyamotoi]ATQ18556.1 N-acetylmannosamine-6-phosphate 2-epimerase [Borrelia miyamotoi]